MTGRTQNSLGSFRSAESTNVTWLSSGGSYRRADGSTSPSAVTRSRERRISTRSRRAREAMTQVTSAEHLQGVCLIGVAIATGRTHQIRVHLSAIGHAVVGDAVYGGRHQHPPPHLRAVQRLERPFLHAAHLSFRHPADGRVVAFDAELPPGLQNVLDELRVTSRAREGRPRS